MTSAALILTPNPFVDVLLTLYSQGRNNKGTRGLTLDGEVCRRRNFSGATCLDKLGH